MFDTSNLPLKIIDRNFRSIERIHLCIGVKVLSKILFAPTPTDTGFIDGFPNLRWELAIRKTCNFDRHPKNTFKKAWMVLC